MPIPYVKDSRRLTGRTIMLDVPGAVLEVEPPAEQAKRLLARWRHHALALARELGWREARATTRFFAPSGLLALSAPIDQLHTATFLNEYAWELALADVASCEAPRRARISERLARRAAASDRPELRALYRKALRRRAQVLIGDNDISFGEGDRTVVFAADQIPAGASPDFARLRHRLPTALVTGTNGKTTTVRLLARMMQEAGLRAGFCCTDSVEVAGEVLDRDDYSGPGGTRRVLRHANTEAAVLEVARGGLLRRGLGVRDADVAIVTNIAEDHLHDMGVHTLAQMAEVKFLLAGSLARGAPLVTNASNRWCRAAAVRTGRPILWFAANSKSRRLLPKRARSIGFATIVDGVVQLERGRRTIELMPMADAPLTLGGAAAHNVENLLAAASAALALRLPREAIVSAARQFGARPDDNRGRNNSFAINGATVIADFGHNPDSLRAVFATARALRSGRLAISLGQAGDRDDAAIRALGALAAAERPDLLILKDMEKYRRGRAAGDIPTLLAAGARAGGLAADQTRVVATDQESLDVVLPWLGPGDLAVLFVHTDVDAVLARLAGLAQPR